MTWGSGGELGASVSALGFGGVGCKVEVFNVIPGTYPKPDRFRASCLSYGFRIH